MGRGEEELFTGVFAEEAKWARAVEVNDVRLR